MRRPFNSWLLGLLLMLGLAALGSACADPNIVTATLGSSSAQPSSWPSAAATPADVTPSPPAPPAGTRPTTTPAVTNASRPTAALSGTVSAIMARVRIDGQGLRLHTAPKLSAEVLAYLDALTPLGLAGRTPDNVWIQVSTPSGQTGWVAAAWTNIYVSLADVPVTGTDQATAAPTTRVSGENYAGFVSGISAHARQVFQLGQSLGNKANVFSKVGDSITVSPLFLSPVGIGDYNLHNHTALLGLIDFYRAGIASGNDNSFDNLSLAAKVSWRAHAELSPELADPAYCDPGETPLACEYRVVRPSVALIMLGTNDVPLTSDADFEADLSQVVQVTLERGIIPVLSTIPPLFRTGLDGRAEQLNVIIVKLARAYDIPLWDYWSALQGLPESGMASDGVHPNWAPEGHNADFAPEYLQYGMVVRNLTALYVLDAIWRQVLRP